MKNFLICVFGGTLILLSSCKDIDEVPNNSAQNIQQQAPQRKNVVRQNFPVNRTVTDSQGRSIEAVILSKSETEIAIEKASTGDKFVIPIERLSQEDQDYLSGLRAGGDMPEVKAQIAKEAKLAGRVVRWHRDVGAAERESAQLGLPMLLAILINGNVESQTLEKKLSFSNEFRDFAAKRLVLCMLKIDDPESNRTTSYSAVEDRNHAARYGVIEYMSPTVLLINSGSGTSVELSHISIGNPETAKSSIMDAFESQNRWAKIVAMEAPKKSRAKVNQREEEDASY